MHIQECANVDDTACMCVHVQFIDISLSKLNAQTEIGLKFLHIYETDEKIFTDQEEKKKQNSNVWSLGKQVMPKNFITSTCTVC